MTKIERAKKPSAVRAGLAETARSDAIAIAKPAFTD
jgi:hypothetical protein